MKWLLLAIVMITCGAMWQASTMDTFEDREVIE